MNSKVRYIKIYMIVICSQVKALYIPQQISLSLIGLNNI